MSQLCIFPLKCRAERDSQYNFYMNHCHHPVIFVINSVIILIAAKLFNTVIIVDLFDNVMNATNALNLIFINYFSVITDFIGCIGFIRMR